MVINFPTKQHSEAYSSLLDRIRAGSKAINDDGGWQEMPPDTFRRRMIEWLELCRCLQEQWGHSCVPPDMREAWEEGERLMKMAERLAIATVVTVVNAASSVDQVDQVTSSTHSNDDVVADRATSSDDNVDRVSS